MVIQAKMRICVEGNVGCGKSHLLSSLTGDWEVRQEPVDQWHDLLKLFYADPRRWAFAMNVEALLSFASIPVTTDVTVIERSPLSCKEVFGRMHKNDGVMCDKEWQLLSDMYGTYGWEPDVIIYLSAPAAICLERTRKRARSGEEEVTHEYLSKLQFAHNTMLRWYTGEVHIVDATQTREAVTARVNDILQAYL